MGIQHDIMRAIAREMIDKLQLKLDDTCSIHYVDEQSGYKGPAVKIEDSPNSCFHAIVFLLELHEGTTLTLRRTSGIMRAPSPPDLSCFDIANPKFDVRQVVKAVANTLTIFRKFRAELLGNMKVKHL
jgi:hypothetical protein